MPQPTRSGRDELSAVATVYSRIDGVQSWVIAQTEVNLEHATVLPPAIHISLEIWQVAANGIITDALGYEMVPPRGRRYDPLTRHSGPDTRRYRLRCSDEQTRTLHHLCERHMVGVPYDVGALLAALLYERSHPRKVGQWEMAHVRKFDCCAAFTALARIAGIPVLGDWKVGFPPVIMPPRCSTPSSVETWLSRNADPFEQAISA